jgi:putative CRISPR-associated protein (TIGR02620 family)
MTTLVVTKHPALVELLHERGELNGECEVVPHISDPSILDGRDVVGVLPLHLAARCNTISTLQINTPQEFRTQELGLELLRKFAGPVQKFKVQQI